MDDLTPGPDADFADDYIEDPFSLLPPDQNRLGDIRIGDVRRHWSPCPR